jgi:hypothetical protein
VDVMLWVINGWLSSLCMCLTGYFALMHGTWSLEDGWMDGWMDE